MATPRELDQRSTEDGVHLRDLVRAIPRDCLTIDPWRAWGGLLRALLCVALCQVALTRVHLQPDASLVWTLPSLAALTLLCGWSMTGLFVIGHDAGHMVFSERRWVNRLVGQLCMAPMFSSFEAWIVGHNHHHVHSNVRKVETNWAEQMVTVEEYRALPRNKQLEVIAGFGSPVGILIGQWLACFRYLVIERSYPQVGPLPQRTRRALHRSNLLVLLCTGGLLTGLGWGFGAAVLLKHYLLPLCVASAMGALFTLLHHNNEDSLVYEAEDATPFRKQVVSTFDVKFPWLIERLCFDINVHLVHHLTPRVPWYNLRRATAAVKAQYPDYVQERTFGLALLRGLWRKPLLARDREHGYLTYVAPPATRRRPQRADARTSAVGVI